MIKKMIFILFLLPFFSNSQELDENDFIIFLTSCKNSFLSTNPGSKIELTEGFPKKIICSYFENIVLCSKISENKIYFLKTNKESVYFSGSSDNESFLIKKRRVYYSSKIVNEEFVSNETCKGVVIDNNTKENQKSHNLNKGLKNILKDINNGSVYESNK